MSHQHGLSNNGTETTGFTEPDDSDDRVQKESENVVHSRMVSNGRSSRIQDLWEIRLPHVFHSLGLSKARDGNALNEVRVLCNSILLNDGVFREDKGIKLRPDTSVLRF